MYPLSSGRPKYPPDKRSANSEGKLELLSGQHNARKGCVAIDVCFSFVLSVPKKSGVAVQSLSEARSSVPLYSQCSQCFICREWSWNVSRCFGQGVELCLSCYVDVLEVRQARGVMGREVLSQQPSTELPGNCPSPFQQMDLFDS